MSEPTLEARGRYVRAIHRALLPRTEDGALAPEEHERVRSALAESKTADVLRRVFADLWQRAGAAPGIREAWRDVVPLLDEKSWLLARDLALLALVSIPAVDPAATGIEG